MEVTHKPCGGKHGCGEMLPLEDFGLQERGKYGRRASCKKCRSTYEKKRYKENPEVRAKQSAATKAYYKANPDKAKANMAAYYEANAEKQKAAVKAWQKANPDKVKANMAAWYKANPEKQKANVKAWQEANPDYIQPWIQAGLDMGVIVYCIRNYDGLGNDYVGCTQNLPVRMNQHKNGNKVMGIPPKLNTENAEVLHECGDDREKGDKLEAGYHAQGYHGAPGDNSWSK